MQAGSSAVPFTTVGGNNNIYPRGRKVTQWEVNDNFIWTHGRSTYKFGLNTRRLDVSNYDLGEGTVPTVTYTDLAQFTYGAAYTASQTFPVRLRERVAVSNIEFYAMDTIKATPKLTFTAGLRVSNNGNVLNQQGLSARPAGSFLDQIHSNSQALSQFIQTGQHSTFPSTPLFIYQPRVSVAYHLPRRAAVHAGFGVFSDLIPAQIADLAAMNAPYAPTFVGGLGGQVAASGSRPAFTAVPSYGLGLENTSTVWGWRSRWPPEATSMSISSERAVCTRRIRYSSTATRMFARAALRLIAMAAARSAIRQRECVSHPRQQQLCRPADQLHGADRDPDPARQLHPEPLS